MVLGGYILMIPLFFLFCSALGRLALRYFRLRSWHGMALRETLPIFYEICYVKELEQKFMVEDINVLVHYSYLGD